MVHHEHVADEGQAFWARWIGKFSAESEEEGQQKQKRESEKEWHVQRLKKRIHLGYDMSM